MSELSFSDLLADGFVIGAILLCWWAIAAVLMLPEVALGESIVTSAFRWLAILLVLTGMGNALVYAIARGISLSEETEF
jgi:hypothetical protein